MQLKDLAAALRLTASDKSPPGYVAILNVRGDFQLPANLQLENIPGLTFCQLLSGADAQDSLVTVWQSHDHFIKGQVLLSSLLVDMNRGDVTFERQGKQSQKWQKQKKKTFGEWIFSWAFVVNALAVFGVIQGLATYFETFGTWTFARPGLAVVAAENGVDLVEQLEDTHKLQIRNDATRGKARVEINRVYVTPVSQEGNSPTREQTLKITSSKIFQSVDPGATLDLNFKTPQLPPGDYSLQVEATHDCGWVWRLLQFRQFTMPVPVKVSPRIKVENSESLALRKKSASTVTMVYNMHFIPYRAHKGIICQASLVHSKAKIVSADGDFKSRAEMMTFAAGSEDSGVMWETREGDAKVKKFVDITLEGPPDTHWNEVLSKIEIDRPQFSLKE